MNKGVQIVEISERQDGQRLDNVLMLLLKGVPRSAVYRLIRTGQVRLNGKRCKPLSRVEQGDKLRVPPFRQREATEVNIPDSLIDELRSAILFEDADFLVLDKPAGIPVHAGTGFSFGIIDAVRKGWGLRDIDLAHRLDRETSGCLVMAKNRRALKQVQVKMQAVELQKTYFALLMGRLPDPRMEIEFALTRSLLKGGERMVMVDPEGKPAKSVFRVLEQYRFADFVEVTLLTGRTHQIRVHSAAIEHPVAGDEKYGDRKFNGKMRSAGLQRMFLHAHHINLPGNDGETIPVHAPLPDDLRAVLDAIPARERKRSR
jgi:23S rRNA pseudouridine955/2504/2580 synthase